MNRPTTFALAGATALALGLTACSTGDESLPGQSAGSSESAGAVDSTLDIGLSADMSAPDPSSAYDGTEVTVVNAAYEGLLKYESGADVPQIVPSLATDWTVSEDGLTYSFTLREGVTFHDGTAFTSASVQPSIDRMLAEGANGPGYMVEDIASVETPSDLEVVFTLGEPNDAFLDYLASPFGLKMIAPSALEEHGDDVEWFANNDAGTGPFMYGSFEPGVAYTLDAYDGYWGDTGGYESVQYHVLDSTNTIQLQLESAELDGYMGSANKTMFDALSANDSLQTYTYPSLMSPVVFLNPASPFFGDAQTRTTLLSGIDWDGLTESVYGDLGSPAEGVFPQSLISAEDNVSTIEYDEAALAELADGALAGESVNITYPSYVPGAQTIADSVAAQLNGAGITTESVGLGSGAYWSTVYDPDQAPDITLFSGFPDAAHPDTWAHLFYHSSGGLNLFMATTGDLDAMIDEAAATGDDALYREIAQTVSDSGLWYTLADLDVSAAWQQGIQGAEDASYPLLGITLDFTALSPAE